MGGDDFHKGVKEASRKLDGRGLKVLIVHTRWNSEIVDPLVYGTKSSLERYGVLPQNITVRDVPGAYELPAAAQRLIRLSQQQSTNLVSDVVDDLMTTASELTASVRGSVDVGALKADIKSGPFDAVVCVGVLIKGSTMHFEYIAEAVSQGIMRVGLDTGVPTIFGVLTCLSDEQAMERAGIGRGEKKGHNHGLDWGAAAVEMALLGL
ncbi:dimethylribityllumazine synthase [Coemansia reversa NRRL 1564]|uniref:6,7-dimethyl-8-ribityllumazine synthase n=1 Tax=Coemansia reversa (strain ATCC 12441 / NRRL 1564) TaxID=763665 RepID=A0A2G5B596_COERN|nr:dimethylribityllumazine synthase [Coemansia reversa NRRL 1564]|eukprot:PIA14188.1 dimethylribityllumazine synthase [Coemansia reversa NRRL 1564]